MAMELCKEIEKYLKKSDWGEFIRCDYVNLYQYHFGLGTWIRNHLLQENSNLFALFVRGGVFYKDDMSSLILDLFYISIHNKYK